MKDYASFLLLLTACSSFPAASSSRATSRRRPRSTRCSCSSAPSWPISSARPAPACSSSGRCSRPIPSAGTPGTSRSLHLPRLQHRRPADPSRRSAALHGLHQGRALLLDSAPLPDLGRHGRRRPGDVLSLRRLPVPQGGVPRPHPRPPAHRAPPHDRNDQLPLGRGDRRRHLPALPLSRGRDDPHGRPVPANDEEAVPDRQRVHLQRDPRGGHPFRRHLHHHDPGPAHPQRRGAAIGLTQPWQFF